MYIKMKSKVLKRLKINKDEEEVTTQIYKKGGFTLKEVKDITEAINKKGKGTYQYFDTSLIRILNGDRWSTFTSEESYLNYYEGKVKDVTKFTNNVLQLHITTYQSII